MKNILIIEQNKKKFAFRIPSKPIRYRANCHSSYGQFVQGDLSKVKNLIEADKAGFLYGDTVDFVVVSLSNKILSFEPHYQQENFLEVWGFPVDGLMHERNCQENSSELCTFLLHRRSMDKIGDIVADIEREADNDWIKAGMPENMEEFIQTKKTELLVESIFQFQFVLEKGKAGDYFWLNTTRKPAESDLAKAALSCSKRIYELNAAQEVCVDPRIEENQQQTKHLMLLEGNNNPEQQPNF